ncbi:hypothetical protein IJ579_07630 [bacterium]|nr:hypothetical protein [bacterium]
MYVSGISAACVNLNNYNNYDNRIQKSKDVFDSFSPSFKGYEQTLIRSVRKEFKKDFEVEECFKNLLRELIEKENILRIQEFNEILKIYKDSGFKGLLEKFWKSRQPDYVEKILNKIDYGNEMKLVTFNEAPLFEMVNFGKQGFRESSPNDIRFIFRTCDQNIAMEFGLGRNGQLKISQSDLGCGRFEFSEFHVSSGNKKVKTVQYAGGNPETTYYNKDGSKSFLRNLLSGGTIIIPQ